LSDLAKEPLIAVLEGGKRRTARGESANDPLEKFIDRRRDDEFTVRERGLPIEQAAPPQIIILEKLGARVGKEPLAPVAIMARTAEFAPVLAIFLFAREIAEPSPVGIKSQVMIFDYHIADAKVGRTFGADRNLERLAARQTKAWNAPFEQHRARSFRERTKMQSIEKNSRA
jgi:hypothetical protein